MYAGSCCDLPFLSDHAATGFSFPVLLPGNDVYSAAREQDSGVDACAMPFVELASCGRWASAGGSAVLMPVAIRLHHFWRWPFPSSSTTCCLLKLEVFALPPHCHNQHHERDGLAKSQQTCESWPRPANCLRPPHVAEAILVTRPSIIDTSPVNHTSAFPAVH